MGKRFTMADLAKLRPGMVPDMQPAAKAPVVKRPPKKSNELNEIKAWLRILGIEFVEEHRFHEQRRWRFDIALPDRKLAIEYEGTVSEKSRHTTLSGYANDCTKYNAAVKQGWSVLRYTALNYQEFMKDITELLQIKTHE